MWSYLAWHSGLHADPGWVRHVVQHPLKDYDYDVATANQILDDAGYFNSNGDGVHDMPDGQPSVDIPLELAEGQLTTASHGGVVQRNGVRWVSPSRRRRLTRMH